MVTAMQLARIREMLGGRMTGAITMSTAAKAIGVSRGAWARWEASERTVSPVAATAVRMLCIEQGLIDLETDFAEWLVEIGGDDASED